MEERTTQIDYKLLPLSWLYRMGTDIRNKLFDWGWLQSKSFDLPVICIGNLSVGGTGKTPHTEYLIKLLQNEGFHPATLSRGYKRRTKGYLLASPKSTAQQIGDEPCQMKQKFPDIQVAVDENRCHGIEQLLKLQSPPVDVILLDDAFQHRHVKAGLNILLTDYHRLFCDDTLLPAGRLRESADGKSRAQIVIVTKCPEDIKFLYFPLRHAYASFSGSSQKPPNPFITDGSRTSTIGNRYSLAYPIAERSEIIHTACASDGLFRPSRLPLERFAGNRGKVLSVKRMGKADHYNRERCRPTETSSRLAGRNQTLHLCSTDRNRDFTKSTT